MPRSTGPLPTASELEILQVIWDRGPSTVRAIGYSTVLKFMQIMTDKGTLVRDESVRPQVYRASQSQRSMQRGIIRDLVARAFGGSSASLVLQALSDRKATREERRQIRQLLDSLERRKK